MTTTTTAPDPRPPRRARRRAAAASIYGVEAETDGGWCLAEAQLALSGIMVARTIYDTLTAPNAAGDYVPYLAESVEPNGDYTQWTITIRDGVKFHDGTDLTAEVVKNNLDAYRGEYRDAGGNLIRRPLLFTFVFQDVAAVDVADPRTVVVTTARPWVAFPAYLFASGRLGIMGQAQLDDAEDCDENLDRHRPVPAAGVGAQRPSHRRYATTTTGGRTRTATSCRIWTRSSSARSSRRPSARTPSRPARSASPTRAAANASPSTGRWPSRGPST